MGDVVLLTSLVRMKAVCLIVLILSTTLANAEPLPFSSSRARLRTRLDRSLPSIQVGPLTTLKANSFLSSSPATTPIVPPGPAKISTGEYRFAPQVDPEIMERHETEVWAKAYWPQNLGERGPSPIVFLLHGNHTTCAKGSHPHEDTSCTYTLTGTCPTGMDVLLNHVGYDYIGEHLASHGFVVVSINANRGITCGYSSDNDFGLIGARARLVLKHMKLWKEWTKRGAAPTTLVARRQEFLGAIDFSHVGLFGHSRGAEAMRAVHHFVRENKNSVITQIPELKIRGLFEIGGTDGLGGASYDALGVAWNQVLPLCDGDVSDMSGYRPFQRMLEQVEEADPTPKSVYLAWGTNHNFFNSEWQENDSYGCENHQAIFRQQDWESPSQRQLGLLAVSDFFRAHVGSRRQPILARHFNPLYQLPSMTTEITNVDRDMTISPSALYTTRFESFNQPTGVNSHGELNSAAGVQIEHGLNPGAKSHHARIQWTRAGTDVFFQSNWAAPGQARSMAGFATLDFRVSRSSDLQVNSDPLTDFSIQLVHQDESLSESVPVSQFSQVRGPVHSLNLYQTVRIPLSAFPQAQLEKARGIRFMFDRTRQGEIFIKSIRLATRSNIEDTFTAPVRLTRASWKKANDRIRAEILRYSTQYKADLRLRTNRAFISTTRLEKNSPQLLGQDVVEMVIFSLTRFPVIEDLPVLMIGQKEFRAIRFDNGSTRRLILSIPKADWDRLEPGQAMLLKYGRRLRFQLPAFDPTRLK
ncbi:MAG: hypothetical protein NDI61_07060 [Bdellovibrionaceae bacterium]|nr:hypothetical protein [Pseudobdellovibrionaceae bacterium]